MGVALRLGVDPEDLSDRIAKEATWWLEEMHALAGDEFGGDDDNGPRLWPG